MSEELLHKIDKRLAVLEALNDEHVQEAKKQMSELRKDFKQIQTELAKLKINVAAISGSISIVVGFILQYYFK